MNIETKVDVLPERHVAYVSFSGNYMGKSEVFKGLFEKLLSWAGPKGLLTPDVLMLSAYYDNPEVTPPEEMTVDVCMTVSEDVEVSGEVNKKTLPGGKYAVASVELAGAEEYGTAWEEVVKWSRENSFELDMSRASYEIYKNDPNTHPEGHHILDICLAVK